jgi:hypothetical protein
VCNNQCQHNLSSSIHQKRDIAIECRSAVETAIETETPKIIGPAYVTSIWYHDHIGQILNYQMSSLLNLSLLLYSSLFSIALIMFIISIFFLVLFLYVFIKSVQNRIKSIKMHLFFFFAFPSDIVHNNKSCIINWDADCSLRQQCPINLNLLSRRRILTLFEKRFPHNIIQCSSHGLCNDTLRAWPFLVTSCRHHLMTFSKTIIIYCPCCGIV